jgi:hypothetical protein
MTSSKPVGQRRAGDWGGLIIVGNATISKTTANPEVEGTGTDGTAVVSGPTTPVTYGGGTVDTDDSGELRYVRVEFAGFGPRANQELNSFTFAGVGSGTRMSFLQSLYGLDDTFEWFGGTNTATNLVSYESGDDHFDMSEGFRGRLQNLIACRVTPVLNPQGPARTSAPTRRGSRTTGATAPAATTASTAPRSRSPLVANFTLVGSGTLNAGAGRRAASGCCSVVAPAATT